MSGLRYDVELIEGAAARHAHAAAAADEVAATLARTGLAAGWFGRTSHAAAATAAVAEERDQHLTAARRFAAEQWERAAAGRRAAQVAAGITADTTAAAMAS